MARHGLSTFLLLSAALHLGLLALGSPLRLAGGAVDAAPALLQARLIPAPRADSLARPAPRQRPAAAPPAPNSRHHVHASRRSTPRGLSPAPARTARSVHRTAPAGRTTPSLAEHKASRRTAPPGERASSRRVAPRAAAEQAGQLRGRVKAALRRALVRGFYYPLVARRMGWQGVVHLRFVVRGDGRIDTVRVARGSGHAVLDHAALKSAAKLERLPIEVSWPGASLLEVDLPVRFELRG